MNKSIKKSLKFLMIFVGILLIFPTILFILLRVHTIQNFVARRVTEHISEKLQTTVSLGKIEYDFFNTLSLTDILIKDRNNDTLIYSKDLNVSIRNIGLRSGYVRLGKVRLENPVISLITDTTGTMNLQWYLDLLKSDKSGGKKSSFRIIIDDIALDKARFSLLNQTLKKGKSPVDFANLRLDSLSGNIEDFVVQGDSVTFNANRVDFTESSGFRVDDLSSHAVIGKEGIKLNSLHLKTNESILNLDWAQIRPDSITAYRNFTDDVELDIVFDKSLISSSDLKYFAPIPAGINESVWLSGRFFGTVSELRGRNINIAYADNTNMTFDFDVTDLTNFENAFIYVDVSHLQTNAQDISTLDLTGKGNLKLPDFLYNVGTFTFDGSFTGFTTDFVTYGKIRSSLGNVRVDLSLRPEKSRFRIKGLVNGSMIDLASIARNNELFGKMSMNANIDGYASSFENFAANLTGNIDSIEINSYNYRNVTLNGFFTEKMWDGNISVEEENIKMELLGLFNFRGELPEFDFSLNLHHADLYKLNFDKKDSTASVSMLLTSNFIGNNIDNLDGEIKLINSQIVKYGNTLDLKGFSVRTYTESGKPAISLRTDFADADVKGYYSFSGLSEMVRSMLHGLVPAVFTTHEAKETKGVNNFTFSLNLKNTDKINNFFRTGMLISENTTLTGMVTADSVITVNCKATLFNFRNNVFNDLLVDAYVTNKTLSANVNTSSLEFLGQTELKGFETSLDAKPDSFNFKVDWDNGTTIKNLGLFSARGSFTRQPESPRTRLDLTIDSSNVYVRDKLWKISRSSIQIDSNAVKIHNMFIANNGYYYKVNGNISKNPADTLYLSFRGIDISPLNYILTRKKAENETIPLNISGRLNGNVLLTGIYKNLLVEGNIRINGLSMLNNEYGDLSLMSQWDRTEKVIDLKAGTTLNSIRMLDMSGLYDPDSREINLVMTADRLPLGGLNPLLKSFASGISGQASGRLRLSGPLNKLNLTGSVMAQNAAMKIDYLQTVYKLNDSIFFNPNAIRFNKVRLTDVNGNTAILNGNVYHQNLKDYRADLTVNTNRAMVLNTKARDNEMFYGTAFATGVTTIKTNPELLSFDISARTEANTKVFIPLTSNLTMTDYKFVSFIDPRHPDTLKISGVKQPPEVAKQTGIDLNIDLEVTPVAEVKLIFDEKVGDEMTGVGSGDLNISLDSKGNFKIIGDYNIEKGNYLFTLGNILNKSFEVESGGRISFNGNIDDSEIDIKAIYKLTTSLQQILQDDERYKERTDVNCILNLTGNLFNPAVKLDIDLPNADEATRTYLKSMINTDEEMNRQFFSLLAMNSFMATSTTTSSGTSALSVTTFEMLSNQLSNWLSQLSSEYNLSVNYRPGTRSMNSQELEVALSTQLLNDKVMVNIRGTSITGNNTSEISGDFDAEIKITDRIRFKVFNRYNNPYTGKLADYTQGIGLFYRQEFDRFSNLFRKKEKPEMKKEEEPAVETVPAYGRSSK
jgi:hypothetical protein